MQHAPPTVETFDQAYKISKLAPLGLYFGHLLPPGRLLWIADLLSQANSLSFELKFCIYLCECRLKLSAVCRLFVH